MEEIWTDTLTFEDVGAAYGDAQPTTRAPKRGWLERVSARRVGGDSGDVTLQIYTDSGLTDLVMEADFTLNGNGDVAVIGGGDYRPTFRAPAGLYMRCLDAADNANDIVFVASGVVGMGA